jgi:hypothetical protein
MGDNKMKHKFQYGSIENVFTSIVFQNLNGMWEVGKLIVALLRQLLFVGHATVCHDPTEAT